MKNPPCPQWFPLAWVAWGPKFPKFIGRTPSQTKKNLGIFRVKIHWEEVATQATQTKGNHREKGGVYSPDFPRAPPKEVWATCWLENPQSSLWFPLALVVWGPKLQKLLGRPGQSKTIGKNGVISPDFPQISLQVILERKQSSPFFSPGLWGELWGKIWVENPHFAYGFLWPGERDPYMIVYEAFFPK